MKLTVISLLASLHGLVILLSLLPGDIPGVSGYQWLTNTLQKWEMFRTAHVTRKVTIVAIGDNGVVKAVAPPRYTSEQQVEALPYRVFLTLNRFLLPENAPERKAWISRVAKQFHEEDCRFFSIEVRRLMVRHFHYSRKDGELYKEFVQKLGPFAVQP